MEQYEIYKKTAIIKSRLAVTLITFCFVSLFSAYYYNNALSNYEQKKKTLEILHNDYSIILAKYKTYQLKNYDFYNNLLLTAIYKNNEDMQVENTSLIGKYFGFTRIFPISMNVTVNEYLENIQSQRIINKVVNNISNILISKNSQELKIKYIEAALEDSLLNNNLKNTLKLITSKYIINIDSLRYKGDLLKWLIFSTFPNEGKTKPIWSNPSSYPNKFEEDSIEDMKWLLYQRLYFTDLKDINSLLTKLWTESYNDLKKSYAKSPLSDKDSNSNVSFGGFSFGIDTVLYFTCPFLILFQLLFFIFWEKEQTLLSDINIKDKMFQFPDFDCISNFIFFKGFNYFAEYLVWILFLLLPLIIILFSIFSRYNMFLLDSIISFDSNIIDFRKTDFNSQLFDYINLFCFLLIVIILINITNTLKSVNKFNNLFWGIFIMVPLVLSFTWFIKYYNEFIFPYNTVNYTFIYFGLYLLICQFLQVIAFVKKSKFSLILLFIISVLNFTILYKFNQ